MSPPLRPRLYVGVAALCLAVLGAVLPATSAHAASRTAQGGRLDWGIKASFQGYVTGPIAKGSYSLTGGTTGSTTGGLADTGSDLPVGTLGAAAAGVVFAMRRRRTEA